MRTTRRWISLVLILALAFSFTFTSASADADAVKNARNGVVRIAFPFQDATGSYVQQGSGFFVGKEGEPVEYIITNAHVVTITDDQGNVLGYPDQVFVVFDDFNSDSTVKANVLQVFENGVDLAILRLEAPTTLRKQLPLRSTKEVGIMDLIYALGFPAIADDSSGYAPSKMEDVTITEGKVTKELYQDGETNYLQIDAAISSGNSGGPLVDENGAVVGINTSGRDPGHGTGFGYALYIDYAMDYFNTMGYPYTTVPSGETTPGAGGETNNTSVVAGGTTPTTPVPEPTPWYVYLAIAIVVAAAAVFVYQLLERKKKQAMPAESGYTVPVGKPTESIRSGRQITSIGQTNVLSGKTYPLRGKTTIGRDPASCQIVFPPKTPGISGKHCMVQELTQGLVVTDLGSTYGTFLENGTKLEPNKPYTILAGEAFFLASKDNGFRVK